MGAWEGAGNGSQMSRASTDAEEFARYQNLRGGVDRGSVRNHWERQIAFKNEGDEAGRSQVVLGQLVCLPEEVGPDFWVVNRGMLRADFCSRKVL